MDITWKKWTARKPVKIICFILALVLCFAAISSVLASMFVGEQANAPLDIIFMDFPSNQYFFDRHMPGIHWNAQRVLRYESEEAIAAREHLRWEYGEEEIAFWLEEYRDGENWYYWDGEDWYYGDWDEEEFIRRGGGITNIPMVTLRDTVDHSNFGSLFGDEDTPENRAAIIRHAVSEQLARFRSSLDFIESRDGLLFHLEVRDEAGVALAVYTNIDRNVFLGGRLDETFMNQPVYFIDCVAGGRRVAEMSHDFEYGVWWEELPAGHSLRIAYTSEFVNNWNSTHIAVRQAYISNLIIFGVCVVLMLALITVVLLGAGRIYGAEGVHFSPLDKPYLDISLAVLIAWTVFAVLIGFDFLDTIWQHSNIVALYLFAAAASIAVLVPVLLWLMSFAKRVKAGKFWRHTLVHFILCKVLFRFLRFCYHSTRALWAGAQLTGKVALISAISLIMLLVIGLLGAVTNGFVLLCLVFTAAIAYFLLRYAKRLRTLKDGAHRASEGNYDTPIDVGGGELGSIAASINNISDGIHSAVEERMKSERLKTELITNVSHDIRTPLTSIITYTDLLKQEGLNSEKAPEYLDVLTQKSQRLKTLTDELFEAAKAVTGNIDVNLSDLDICSLLSQVLGENDSAVTSSGLDIRTNVPDRLLIRADGRLMWRVVENLLSNVLKYSLPGSRVYIDVVTVNDSYMRLDVKNISTAELNFDPSELTERFKRGDDSRSDGGSGLGLSIVQSFVTAQGGRFDISIDGDLFKAMVTLPLADLSGQ